MIPSIEDRVLQIKTSLALAACAMSAGATGLEDGEREDAAIDAVNEALDQVRNLFLRVTRETVVRR
ncbi:MAG TPA: hypothetical protein VES67_26605 [Vicinamibacterales bacterium]|nr:hypothetical protein [Vicinamibacterales bacterium]